MTEEPQLISEINSYPIKLLAKDGFTHISEAIGRLPKPKDSFWITKESKEQSFSKTKMTKKLSRL